MKYVKRVMELLGLPEGCGVETYLRGIEKLTLPKGASVMEPGAIQTHLLILEKGIFRGYLLDSEGREITDCFACVPGMVLMGANALGGVSQIHIEAMVKSQIYSLPVENAKQAMVNIPAVTDLHNRILVEAMQRHWKGKIMMYRCTAMQRYQRFLQEYPGLIDQISNKHIASFLGMTPVSLSQLRRQLREEEKIEEL